MPAIVAHTLMLLPAAIFLTVATTTLLLAAPGNVAPLFLAHAFFAVAALPLMLAAIIHFVPVLTRSGAPPRTIVVAPWLAALAGALALTVFAGLLPRHGLAPAALLAAVAALGVAVWVGRQRRRTLGAPHPGVNWYLASLGCLLLGLAAVFGMVFDGERHFFWRHLHVHINLFGWIGLTALGTLPVLLPTALNRPESSAAARLRCDLPLALAGTVTLAFAAALRVPVVAALGAMLLAAVPLRHLLAWRRVFGWRDLARGVAASLALATAFLSLLLLAGVGHSFGMLPADRLVLAFVFGFLLPLVTGALAQLLPVWRFAGPRTPAREAFRLGLARHAGGRGLVFVLAGTLQLFAAAGDWVQIAAMVLATAGMVAFLFALLRRWRLRPDAG